MLLPKLQFNLHTQNISFGSVHFCDLRLTHSNVFQLNWPKQVSELAIQLSYYFYFLTKKHYSARTTISLWNAYFFPSMRLSVLLLPPRKILFSQLRLQWHRKILLGNRFPFSNILLTLRVFIKCKFEAIIPSIRSCYKFIHSGKCFLLDG